MLCPGATSWLGSVQGHGTAQRSSTAHRIQHNPNLGVGAMTLGWAGDHDTGVGRGREGSQGLEQPQPCQKHPVQLPHPQHDLGQDRMRPRSWEPPVGRGAGAAGAMPGAWPELPTSASPGTAGRRPWRHIRPSVRRDQHWPLEPRSALASPGEEGPAAPSLAGAGGWAASGF